jgi:predicted site-specific integrase-resolvase
MKGPQTFVPPRLYLADEVAGKFHVAKTTVARWVRAGKFPDGCVIRTPGGDRRYRADIVDEMLRLRESRT